MKCSKSGCIEGLFLVFARIRVGGIDSGEPFLPANSEPLTSKIVTRHAVTARPRFSVALLVT